VPTYLIVNHKAASVRSPAHDMILAVGLELAQHVVELNRKIAVRRMRGFAFGILQVARVGFVRVVYIVVLHFATPRVIGTNFNSICWAAVHALVYQNLSKKCFVLGLCKFDWFRLESDWCEHSQKQPIKYRIQERHDPAQSASNAEDQNIMDMHSLPTAPALRLSSDLKREGNQQPLLFDFTALKAPPNNNSERRQRQSRGPSGSLPCSIDDAGRCPSRRSRHFAYLQSRNKHTSWYTHR